MDNCEKNGVDGAKLGLLISGLIFLSVIIITIISVNTGWKPLG